MALAKKKSSISHVLKLVDQLSPAQQRQIGKILSTLQELRAALDAGIEQLDHGLGIPAEEVFKSLREHYQGKARKKWPA